MLGRMVDRARAVGIFEGLEVGRDRVCVTSLQYADDATFFSSGDESQVVNLFSLLKLLGVISGLKINPEKSSVVGINMQHNQLQRRALLLGCSIETLLFKCLVLPLGAILGVNLFGLQLWKRFARVWKGGARLYSRVGLDILWSRQF